MKTNYILIDYESVQPDILAVLNRDNFKVIVFVGATQSKVSYDIASVLQKMGDRASYIKISGNGPNALDFHIAFYIGQIAAIEKDTFFHIVSKDKGFDPLIKHLKLQKIFACRSEDVNDIPIIKASNSNTPDDRQDAVINDLKRRGNSKPRTIKSLTSTIHSLFQKQLSEPEVTAILNEMTTNQIVKLNGSKVSYNIPA